MGKLAAKRVTMRKKKVENIKPPGLQGGKKNCFNLCKANPRRKLQNKPSKLKYSPTLGKLSYKKITLQWRSNGYLG